MPPRIPRRSRYGLLNFGTPRVLKRNPGGMRYCGVTLRTFGDVSSLEGDALGIGSVSVSVGLEGGALGVGFVSVSVGLKGGALGVGSPDLLIFPPPSVPSRLTVLSNVVSCCVVKTFAALLLPLPISFRDFSCVASKPVNGTEEKIKGSYDEKSRLSSLALNSMGNGENEDETG